MTDSTRRPRQVLTALALLWLLGWVADALVNSAPGMADYWCQSNDPRVDERFWFGAVGVFLAYQLFAASGDVYGRRLGAAVRAVQRVAVRALVAVGLPDPVEHPEFYAWVLFRYVAACGIGHALEYFDLWPLKAEERITPLRWVRATWTVGATLPVSMLAGLVGTPYLRGLHARPTVQEHSDLQSTMAALEQTNRELRDSVQDVGAQMKKDRRERRNLTDHGAVIWAADIDGAGRVTESHGRGLSLYDPPIEPGAAIGTYIVGDWPNPWGYLEARERFLRGEHEPLVVIDPDGWALRSVTVYAPRLDAGEDVVGIVGTTLPLRTAVSHADLQRKWDR